MLVKKTDLYAYIFFCIAVLVGLIFQEDIISILLVCYTYMYIGYITQSKSSVHMMFFLGFSSFIFLPALLNWYYLDINFSLYFVSAFSASFFLFLTKNTIVKIFVNYGNVPKKFFLSFSLSLILLSYFNLGYIVEPSVGFLIVLFSLCLCQNRTKINFIYLLIFLSVIVFYLVFSWNGFGRTVVVGWILLALLLFSYSINKKVNKYFFSLIPGLGAVLFSKRNFLNLEFSGFEAALDDSAYSPYRLASSFVDHFNQYGYDFSGFIDQIIFTFFVFVPRSIWSNKPYGFGFEYTLQNLDDSLIDAGHSIAATLIGEHLYFIGYLGVFTSLIVFYLIALAINFFYKIKKLNGNGVLVFSASMMVLNWGGMTSFSARIALPSIIFILLFSLFGYFLTRKLKPNGEFHNER